MSMVNRFGKEHAIVPTTPPQLSPNHGGPPQLEPFNLGPCRNPLEALSTLWRPLFDNPPLQATPPVLPQVRRKRKLQEVRRETYKIRIILPPSYEGDDWEPTKNQNDLLLDCRQVRQEALAAFYFSGVGRSIADIEKAADERPEFCEGLFEAPNLRDLLFAQLTDEPGESQPSASHAGPPNLPTNATISDHQNFTGPIHPHY